MAKVKKNSENFRQTRKEKKALAVQRRYIAEVAANLFFKKGFMQTTNQGTAKVYGMSVGTLYY